MTTRLVPLSGPIALCFPAVYSALHAVLTRYQPLMTNSQDRAPSLRAISKEAFLRVKITCTRCHIDIHASLGGTRRGDALTRAWTGGVRADGRGDGEGRPGRARLTARSSARDPRRGPTTRPSRPSLQN